MEYDGKIRVLRAEDREKVAGILSGEGYQVWQGTERPKNSSIYYVYYKDIKEESKK